MLHRKKGWRAPAKLGIGPLVTSPPPKSLYPVQTFCFVVRRAGTMILSRHYPQGERKDRRMMDDLTGGGNGGERATGTPNTTYDLSSVLFHTLEGGTSYDTYIEDAEREGDGELADFFRRVRDEDSMRADDAQRLLAERTPTTTTSATGGGTSAGATGGMGAGATGGGTGIEPVEGAASPSEGFAAGAPRREEALGVTEERPDMDVGPTTPGSGGVGGADTDVGHRTEPSFAREGAEEAPPPRTSGIEEGVLPEREGRTGGTPPRE